MYFIFHTSKYIKKPSEFYTQRDIYLKIFDLFFDIIDHTPPINVMIAPINSLDISSVAKPFATKAQPINVNVCLTIPSICYFFIYS